MTTFQRCEAKNQCTASPSPNDIKIVSYNIMAECWATSTKNRHKYFYVEDKLMEWNHRWSKFQEEFNAFDADLYCFQELEMSKYESSLLPFFKEKGFDGVIQPKDVGNATFFRTSKFEVKKNNPRSRVLIASFVVKQQESSSSSVVESTVLPVASSASTTGSQQQQEKLLHVCNVHLEGDPEKTEERLNQVRSTFKELAKEGAAEKQLTIICGDFNCDNESVVYQLLRTGSVEFTPPKKSKMTLSHGYKFESSYFASEHGEPKYTFLMKNCKANLLDFIFYTTPTMKVKGCLKVVEDAKFLEETFLPNEVNPSDHLPIMAVLEIL